MFQKLLRAAGKPPDFWWWVRPWWTLVPEIKNEGGGKGKMAKPVLSSEKQKEFGACMTVWVHLKDICFLSDTGFLCLSVLSYHQTFKNKSSTSAPTSLILTDNQDITHTLPQATMPICTKASHKSWFQLRLGQTYTWYLLVMLRDPAIT